MGEGTEEEEDIVVVVAVRRAELDDMVRTMMREAGGPLSRIRDC